MPANTAIGEAVTVGAGSILRSCRVHSMVSIGERCIIMEGSVIESESALQAGTVVPPAKYIPSGELWGGNPAQFVRKLTHDEVRHDVCLCHHGLTFSSALRLSRHMYVPPCTSKTSMQQAQCTDTEQSTGVAVNHTICSTKH